MIVGRVNDDSQPMIEIPVRGADGRTHLVEAEIDTGFSGALTLRPDFLAELGHPQAFPQRAVFANGDSRQVGVHPVPLIWDGVPRLIAVHAIDTQPLVGMRLLFGHRLTIDCRPGGAVAVEVVPDA